jgi:2-methylisocitrate lyase-like PEP mutase family enzyme
MNCERNAKTRIFAELHQRGNPFILPNAWDAASARIFEKNGFSAIGTTSAGIAASRGYRDGENIPRSEMLECLKQIINAVNLPVTADIEAGFGESIEEIIDTINQVISLGAVGINIEDGTGNVASPIVDIEFQSDKIKAIRSHVSDELWINARIDVFYLGLNDAVNESIRRAHAYLEAGASSIFIFGVSDKQIISTLSQEIGGPLNILAGPKIPSINELKELGVARVSLGSGPMRATLGLLEEMSQELLSSGTYQSLTSRAVSFPALQDLYPVHP